MNKVLSIDELRQGFNSPPADSKPMVRWWWFGPSVERNDLERQLTEIAAAGFGGVEIAYVYPLTRVEHRFLSEEFCEHLRFAADRARELGLRFDLTLGSGWSFGGPHITDELAARKLHWDRLEVQSAALEAPVVAPWPGDLLVAAYIGDGTAQEAPERFTELPIIDGLIRVPEGRGPRVILLAYSRLTGQNVKRAAVGAEGPVLDHYSAAAAQEHIRRVAEPLTAAVPPELIGSVFCDSLEVYGADWTPDLLIEFAKRRGYDARPLLHLLVIDGEGAERFRGDYYRTLTELYEQNFVSVFQRWAAGRGLRFRIQGYGSPPASVSSYRFADLFEGEGWGWQEITQTRWASSAAHIYGRDVVSSEVWTWVHSPSFRATPLDLKGEAHEHFLAGINQLVGHGWPYTPVDTPGLGWIFYASGAIDDRNPWWPAMRHLTRYLHRLSWLLRQGSHVADVRIYVPAADVYPVMGGGSGAALDLWRATREHIGDDIPRIVRENGLDFDLIDDDAVQVVTPQDTPVVILPFTTAIPEPTLAWLDQVMAEGGSVISVGGTLFEGTIAAGTDNLAEILRQVTRPDVILTPETPDIGVLHRRNDRGDIYFLANTGNTVRSFAFSPGSTHVNYEQWDAMSGDVATSGCVSAGIDISLHPYEATVIVVFDESPVPTIPERTSPKDANRRLLNGPWHIEFLDDARSAGSRPVSLPHRWEAERTGYSGSAAYETTLEADPSWFGPEASRVLLDFGPAESTDAGSAASKDIRGSSYRVHLSPPVREVAVVFVNGVECGTLWAPPYVIDITAYLKPGVNRLRVDVYNTASNALAQDMTIQQWVDESTALYGRRFRMQDLDHVMDSVASGLLTVPSLTWISANT